ncbi:MAG: DNA polymerase Y family protein [Propionibacteriaceae bacterium]
MTVQQVRPEVTAAVRSLVVWCPDWPVVAAMHEEGLAADLPVAVLHKGEVYACSTAARAEGVRRRMRKRDATGRCPELLLVDHQPDLEARDFERVLQAIEEVSPGVEPLRPGLCALRVPSRFYGGEPEAAAVVAERLVKAEVWDCRFGVADGMFAAEQAARRAAPQDCAVIPAAGSAAFLADLPVEVLEDAEMVSLLRRMGIATLGAFAALRARDVLTRFGTAGAWAHRLAGGGETRPASGRRPPPELIREVSFAPGLETIEPIAFSSRQTAETFVADLAHQGLVCTTVLIEVVTERGTTKGRRWSHPRWFGAADLVDRLRWQLQADPAPDPVATVRLVPDVAEALGDRGDRLLGNAPDEQIERVMARVQGLLGYDGVLTAAVQGGRDPASRQALTPWGERSTGLRPPELPWPGSLPPPAPVRVFATPVAGAVLDADDRPVRLTERGTISAEPARFRPSPTMPTQPVQAWAGPWPVDEQWWDPVHARRLARFQLVGADGSAWLMVVQVDRGSDAWWTEASYD